MAKIVGDSGAFARALGIEDPQNVARIVIDVRGHEIPRIYVERIVTDEPQIIDALHALMTGQRIGELWTEVTPLDADCPQWMPTGGPHSGIHYADCPPDCAKAGA